MLVMTTAMYMTMNANAQEWDKTFPQSDKVTHAKVTFRNRFNITLSADLYMPKDAMGKLPAIAVSGPFGAVKEQASGLYAQTLAEMGFITIAFDPSYTGESSGEPRYSSSMDINTEDFCAAVDYLSCRDDVNPERIGILGICGWGGIALDRRRRNPHSCAHRARGEGPQQIFRRRSLSETDRRSVRVQQTPSDSAGRDTLRPL